MTHLKNNFLITIAGGRESNFWTLPQSATLATGFSLDPAKEIVFNLNRLATWVPATGLTKGLFLHAFTGIFDTL
jgi:hypothetical protein